MRKLSQVLAGGRWNIYYSVRFYVRAMDGSIAINPCGFWTRRSDPNVFVSAEAIFPSYSPESRILDKTCITGGRVSIFLLIHHSCDSDYHPGELSSTSQLVFNGPSLGLPAVPCCNPEESCNPSFSGLPGPTEWRLNELPFKVCLHMVVILFISL